jgi:ATP-binding cassette subfamily B protein
LALTSHWKYLSRHWKRLGAGIVLLLAAVASSVAIPYYVGRAVDAFSKGHAAAEVTHLAVIVIVLAVVQAVVRGAGLFLIQWAARSAEHDLRCQLFGHILAMDAAQHRTHSVGDLSSRLTSDMQAVVTTLGWGVIHVVGVGSLLILSVAVMVRIDPILTLWALAPIPPVIFVTRRLGERINRASDLAQDRAAQMSSTVHESLAGIGVIRAYHLQRQRSAQVVAGSQRVVGTWMSTVLAEGTLSVVLGALGAASIFAILWVGGNAAIEGRIELGRLIQFNTYVALLAARIGALGGVVSLIQSGRASWKRLAAILSSKPAIADGKGPPLATPVRGDIDISGLTIQLGGRRVVDDVTLRIVAGTVTAIVGRVGSGKSMLVEAIPRLLDVPTGTLSIDGRDITELPVADLRRAIAYCSQTAFLFSATIAENIAFAIDDPDGNVRQRIEDAVRVAGLDADLAALPDGLETHVGERGITLSGGQRQRVALARAIASDRPIVILDDSLSAVDTETERKILDNLVEALGGRTVIMISHRVTAVRRASQIAVLDEGKLVECGSHDALMANGGLYTDLYKTQHEEAGA